MNSQRGRWGKAGHRLGADEIRKADVRGQHASCRRVLAEQEAHRQWAAGLVVPDTITLSLDAMGLDGPEVDAACGATEPDVDRWEAGELYPTWEQLKLLATLTGRTPIMFMKSYARLRTDDTSARFHMPLAEEEAPLVLAFTPEAITTMKANLS